MYFLPVSLSGSVASLAGLVSTGVVGVMLGRWGSRGTRDRDGTAATRASTGSDRDPPSANVPTPRAGDGFPISPALLRRMRTGRLPLPPQVAELAANDEPPLAAVNAFADRLADLPLSSWLAVGKSLVDNPTAYAHRATPFAILEATINDRGLAVAAWYVRDAIDTSAHYASHTTTRWTSRDRRAFAAAHAVAEETALALLARPHLSADDYSALCAPFELLAREALATD
jgi:hypothetical protein